MHGGDDRVELRWPGSEAVVVLGYAGEPYLRLSPAGAFGRTRARPPSTPTATASASPRAADPDTPPDWRLISSSPVAVWHDHRAHWMSRAQPAGARRDPGRPQEVQRWEIPMRVGSAPASITGRLDYLPPPAAWPWIVGILVAVLALGLTLRRVGAGGAWIARAGARSPSRAALP